MDIRSLAEDNDRPQGRVCRPLSKEKKEVFKSVQLGSNRSVTSTSYGHALPSRRRVHESNLKGALGSIDREVSLHDASLYQWERGTISCLSPFVSPSLAARSSNNSRRKYGRCGRQYFQEKERIHSSSSFPR